MDLKIIKSIVTSDAKSKTEIAKEYTDITIHLLKYMINISGQTNIITKAIVGKILDYQSKDHEWFVKLTAPFFLEHRAHIFSRNIEYFINNDYKSQVEEWNIIFGATISAKLVSIIVNSIKNIINNTELLSEFMECILAVLRKSAKYIILDKDETKRLLESKK
jgi:hypothetical protein